MEVDISYRKLTDSDGEQLETQHWVDTASSCRYLNKKKAEELNFELRQIGKMLNSMIYKANLFCGNNHKVGEVRAKYFTDDCLLNTDNLTY